jgi:hypothetical protein
MGAENGISTNGGRMNIYCQDCIHYPCGDIEDDDTEIIACDYKKIGEIV